MHLLYGWMVLGKLELMYADLWLHTTEREKINAVLQTIHSSKYCLYTVYLSVCVNCSYIKLICHIFIL